MFCKLFPLFFFLLCLLSCREQAPQIPANKLPESTLSNDLMELNKEFVSLEEDEINHYVDSSRPDMKITPLNIRYRIIEEGNGNAPQRGDQVTVNYSIRPLNGEACDKLKNVTKTISLGKNEILRGVEESVYLLKTGGKGEFIIPSYLAFGISGLSDCISTRTPVFCEINLVTKK